MFRYDKDMERVMLEKKKEVLTEIETAKLRVLKELYCLKRSVHTDFCEMLADYNRIDFTLKKLVKDLKAEIKATTDEFRVLMGDTFNEYTTRIENKFTALETFEQEVIQEVNDKLSELETMSAQVEALIAEMEQIVADGVTEADLTALKEELLVAMESAGAQADWNESDETSAAFVKNKTHYGSISNSAVVTHTVVNANVKGNGTSNGEIYMLDGVDLSGYTDLRLTMVDKTVNLKAKTCDVALNYGGQWSFLRNTTVFGELYNGTNQFPTEDDAHQISICQNPLDNNWYLTITNAAFYWRTATITIETFSSTIEKRLDANYLGTSPGLSKVLAFNGEFCEWVDMSGVTTGKMGFNNVINAQFNYHDTVDGYRRYVADIDTGTLLSSVVFFVTVNDTTRKETSLSSGSAAFPGISFKNTTDIYCPSSSKAINGKWTLKVVDDTTTQAINSYNVSIDIYSYTETTIPFKLISPNGTSFILSVSDDGTLSATPVTE